MAGSQLNHVVWHYRQIPVMADVMASLLFCSFGNDLSRPINVQFSLFHGSISTQIVGCGGGLLNPIHSIQNVT